MDARSNLAKLAYEDPQAAAAVVDSLWAELARDDPRMFAALWRRANKSSRRPKLTDAPKVDWLEELPPVEVVAQRVPAVNLVPTVEPLLAQHQGDGLLDVVPDLLAADAAAEPRDLPREPDVLQDARVGEV